MPPSGAAHATEQATLACINVQLAEQPLHPPAAEVARDNGISSARRYKTSWSRTLQAEGVSATPTYVGRWEW
eukprot:CAMPEP_0206480464 /NCGR_PEP_ID=MMETSP0324_2-20121206/37354_1 /ASSEMBLY_ACC=CAM_ASM_000836 /TAXON_ID=2866 /ORGANISM="Crypthecodinium cohnii, Strain Seligo" /LENGTH=71 /DNA_ID=CAMNT_0053957345 /DNA_START=162 /DNA_END=374 /DNA_ORIENTATION=-